MRLYGYYNEDGYQVETDSLMDEILYFAGNSPFDSKQVVGYENALPLETIREYCEQITREMAEEKNADFGGVEYLNRDEI